MNAKVGNALHKLCADGGWGTPQDMNRRLSRASLSFLEYQSGGKMTFENRECSNARAFLEEFLESEKLFYPDFVKRKGTSTQRIDFSAILKDEA